MEDFSRVPFLDITCTEVFDFLIDGNGSVVDVVNRLEIGRTRIISASVVFAVDTVSRLFPQAFFEGFLLFLFAVNGFRLL